MTEKLFDVKDKVAVITGGLGQIGVEFSLELLNRGAKVAVFARTLREDIIEARFPEGYRKTDKVRFYKVDITEKITIETALDSLVSVWEIPHILINNAGIDTQPSAPPEVSGPFENFPVEVFREVVDVNLTACG